METKRFKFILFMVTPFIALGIVSLLDLWANENNLQVWFDIMRTEGLITAYVVLIFMVVPVTWVVAMGFFIAGDFKDN